MAGTERSGGGNARIPRSLTRAGVEVGAPPWLRRRPGSKLWTRERIRKHIGAWLAELGRGRERSRARCRCGARGPSLSATGLRSADRRVADGSGADRQARSLRRPGDDSCTRGAVLPLARIVAVEGAPEGGDRAQVGTVKASPIRAAAMNGDRLTFNDVARAEARLTFPAAQGRRPPARAAGSRT